MYSIQIVSCISTTSENPAFIKRDMTKRKMKQLPIRFGAFLIEWRRRCWERKIATEWFITIIIKSSEKVSYHECFYWQLFIKRNVVSIELKMKFHSKFLKSIRYITWNIVYIEIWKEWFEIIFNNTISQHPSNVDLQM